MFADGKELRFTGIFGLGGQCRTPSSVDSKRLTVVADLLRYKFTSKLKELQARNVADFSFRRVQ
jgi:hypothetical protein